MRDFSYKFGAVRGAQNGRPFYQASVPFRALASMLKLDDDHDVNKRSQRLVEKGRANKVKSYLTRNQDGFWVLPPLVGFIEGEFEFEEVPLDGWSNAGRLIVPMEARIMLFDGQHRAFGIREAMGVLPELGMENISIMFFAGMSLSDRKQAFHDINYTQKTPAASLCIAYNERNQFDKMVIDKFSQSSIRHLIEYEKNTASGVNPNIYSLKMLRDFAMNAVGKDANEVMETNLAIYVSALFEVVNIPAHLTQIEIEKAKWVKVGLVPAKQYRAESIIGHGVALKAFGLLGKYIIENYEINEYLTALERLGDRKLFYRQAEHWLGRCVNDQEKMVSNQLAVRLTYYKLKDLCGIELTDAEKAEEKSHFEELEVSAA